MADDLDQMALDYHRWPTPGKIAVVPTKNLANQRDLALAYSPGVAKACTEIAENPGAAADYTIRSNLVAVITNGTAVLGLGNIGPLASKPVMEGKGVLFKKFADVNVFDLEIAETDPEKFIDIVASLEPTFGGINLEDIKAPECFVIEKALRERMNIPVFHDDQHGTAICVSAAVYNGLRVVGKDIAKVRLVCSGAGAAALACLDLLVSMGLPEANILVNDRTGIVYAGREGDMDPYKGRYAQETKHRTLADAMDGADIFLGLSAPGVLTGDMVKTMADKPIIMALANPTPEILPEIAKEARPDAIIATGRSDYPNQVNNVLCFPARAYSDQSLSFGPEYLIPKPFDPRLIVELAPAVAKAAMDSGVATRPIEDFDAYRVALTQHVYRSGLVMKPVFDRAREAPMRIAYADGEDEKVLRTVQIVLDDVIGKPILIGRRSVVESRIEKLGLRYKLDEDVELVDPQGDPRYRDYWTEYHRLMGRDGISPDAARTIVRTRSSVIGALMVRLGDADATICGTAGRYERQLKNVRDVIGLRDGVRRVYAVQLLILTNGDRVHHRYKRQLRPDGRASGGSCDAGGRGGGAVWT